MGQVDREHEEAAPRGERDPPAPASRRARPRPGAPSRRGASRRPRTAAVSPMRLELAVRVCSLGSRDSWAWYVFPRVHGRQVQAGCRGEASRRSTRRASHEEACDLEAGPPLLPGPASTIDARARDGRRPEDARNLRCDCLSGARSLDDSGRAGRDGPHVGAAATRRRRRLSRAGPRRRAREVAASPAQSVGICRE